MQLCISNISMAGTQGMTVQEPVYLTLNEQNQSQEYVFQIEELQEGTEMYDGIVFDFENSGFKVDKIERLENYRLKKKYITERDRLLEDSDNPDFQLNEKFLYHGTSSKKAQICEEGLDHRIAKQGCFGKGIYFSDYPRKCMKYAEKGGCTESIILLMRVILGEIKEYPRGVKDRSLVREPEKTQPYVGNRFYDSVKGCPVNHNEFVVYESRRALVECIVTYSKIHNTLSEPSDPVRSVEAAKPFTEDSDTSSDDDVLLGATGICGSKLYDYDQDNSSSSDSDDEVAHNAAKGGRLTRKNREPPERLIGEQANTIPIHARRLMNMSEGDRDAAIQVLVDNILEAMGKDLRDEEDRRLAEKYLKAADMDCDEAMCMFISTLSAHP